MIIEILKRYPCLHQATREDLEALRDVCRLEDHPHARLSKGAIDRAIGEFEPFIAQYGTIGEAVQELRISRALDGVDDMIVAILVNAGLVGDDVLVVVIENSIQLARLHVRKAMQEGRDLGKALKEVTFATYELLYELTEGFMHNVALNVSKLETVSKKVFQNVSKLKTQAYAMKKGRYRRAVWEDRYELLKEAYDHMSALPKTTVPKGLVPENFKDLFKPTYKERYMEFVDFLKEDDFPHPLGRLLDDGGNWIKENRQKGVIITYYEVLVEEGVVYGSKPFQSEELITRETAMKLMCDEFGLAEQKKCETRKGRDYKQHLIQKVKALKEKF